MDYSLSDIKAMMDDDRGTFGGNGFLWVILIFLFFLAFAGGWGKRDEKYEGLSQVERDVLTTSASSQRDILENRYNTLLGFKDQQLQISECCLTWLQCVITKIIAFFTGNHKRNLMLG